MNLNRQEKAFSPSPVLSATNASRAKLFDACLHDAAQVHDISGFKDWIRNSVRPLLAHGTLVCVHGRTHGIGVSLDYLVAIDHPLEHLAAIRNPSGHMDTPLARLWFEQRAPIFFDASSPSDDIPATWLEQFHKYDLVNVAADGVLDKANCIVTYFSFHRLPELDEVTLRATFETLTPLLHDVFTRVIRSHQARTIPLADRYNFLNSREQEIAVLITQGKTNSDIAAVLNVSEYTIRNYVSRILNKTGCKNRASLAAAVTLHEQCRFGLGTKVL